MEGNEHDRQPRLAVPPEWPSVQGFKINLLPPGASLVVQWLGQPPGKVTHTSSSGGMTHTAGAFFLLLKRTFSYPLPEHCGAFAVLMSWLMKESAASFNRLRGPQRKKNTWILSGPFLLSIWHVAHSSSWKREITPSTLTRKCTERKEQSVWTSCPVGTYKSFKCLSVHLVPECENILKTQNVLFGYW